MTKRPLDAMASPFFPSATIVSTVTVDSLSGGLGSIVHLPFTGGFATGHGWPGPFHIRVWTAEGVLEATLEGHTGTVYALAARGCGGLVSGSYDRTARVWSWDNERTACVAVLRGHTRAVVAVAVHPSNDNIVVTGSYDRTARVWDVASSTCTAVLEGHTDSVWAVAFQSDGSIVSGSDDKTVRVWSPDGSCKSVLEHPNCVYCLTVLPDDTFIVGGGFFRNGFVRKWAGDVEQWTTTHTNGEVASVSPEAFRLQKGQVVFFDAADGRETGGLKPAWLMAGMPGGKVMLYDDKQVFVVRVYRVRGV